MIVGGYTGVMENSMETTRRGLYRVRVWGTKILTGKQIWRTRNSNIQAEDSVGHILQPGTKNSQLEFEDCHQPSAYHKELVTPISL